MSFDSLSGFSGLAAGARQRNVMTAKETPTESFAGVLTPKEESAPVEESSVADQFLSYMNKSPAERMRESILNSLGYTEEQLDAMSAEERQKIELKIQRIIEEAAKKEMEKHMRGEQAKPDAAPNAQASIAAESKDALLRLQEIDQVQPQASVMEPQKRTANGPF